MRDFGGQRINNDQKQGGVRAPGSPFGDILGSAVTSDSKPVSLLRLSRPASSGRALILACMTLVQYSLLVDHSPVLELRSLNWGFRL